MSSAPTAKPNHLLREKSPYLQQHAYNPVDWYPWGPEAFEKARREDKPILVSIGYSTCHWCHVMERESYEDPPIGELMNTYLVNIKVDREERPDVDKIYMTAVTAMTGSGGWPLNVFLTPDLKPFYGGTYFPPAARWGHPGWKEVVTQIGTSWKNPEERKKILNAGNQITDALTQYAQSSSAPVEGRPEWLDEAFRAFKASYDSSRGGFGGAPKFPMPVNLTFLLRYYARTHNPDALEMVTHTLKEMARGGIYDQLGGGFARYSTDARWHIPHFEKMLYDNAQLAVNYLDAFQITREPEFQRIARETLDYVARDMTSKEGAFYSAEDADSLPGRDAKEKKEGAFYVWEKGEIEKALGRDDSELFAFRYGVRDSGNAADDPHGEFPNKNILYLAHPIPETARQFKLSERDVEERLEKARHRLFTLRVQRPRPHLDDKVLSAWNGLMISAYARAYHVLGEPNDLKAAQRAAVFIQKNLYDASSKQLYRSWREGERHVAGIADDYAFVVQGLLDLYEADFNPEWLRWAIELTDVQIARFYDSPRGGFYMTASGQDPHLIVRVKEDQDNVEPAASSIAALNLLRLAQFTDNTAYRSQAEKTLQAFGATLEQSPRAMPAMLAALDFALSDPMQVIIAGTSGTADTENLLKTLHRHFIPVKIVMLSDPRIPTGLPKAVQAMKPLQGHATAYVCKHFTCKKPTTNPAELDKDLAL
jgi:uncharacterized protein YyaL (SSP411 family)